MKYSSRTLSCARLRATEDLELEVGIRIGSRMLRLTRQKTRLALGLADVRLATVEVGAAVNDPRSVTGRGFGFWGGGGLARAEQRLNAFDAFAHADTGGARCFAEVDGLAGERRVHAAQVIEFYAYLHMPPKDMSCDWRCKIVLGAVTWSRAASRRVGVFVVALVVGLGEGDVPIGGSIGVPVVSVGRV